MSSAGNDHVLVHAEASTIAFRAGQRFEELLLERGAEIARRSQSPVVGAEHVLSGLDGSLFEQLKQFLDEQPKQRSRKVA
ncbi:MAG TPA: hypothetical protein VG125_29170 [Pirellulales bacterium]|jgi:hypothetical protein|nr:hypothetical protein [Pirellulales bacterium]